MINMESLIDHGHDNFDDHLDHDDHLDPDDHLDHDAHCRVDPSDLTKWSITHSVSHSVTYVGIDLLGQLKII